MLPGREEHLTVPGTYLTAVMNTRMGFWEHLEDESQGYCLTPHNIQSELLKMQDAVQSVSRGRRLMSSHPDRRMFTLLTCV